MYYEEKMIGNVLHWRNSPNGKWTAYSAADLSCKLFDERARLSIAEKVVEAAEALRNEPHIYDVEMGRYVKCIEHDRCDLCKTFDAALSAYRSAK